MSQDSRWMLEAFNLALRAKEQGEVPIGAVLVDAHQQRIGVGWNQVIQLQDPSGHAELIAIREGAKAAQNYRLLETTLYDLLQGFPLNHRVQIDEGVMQKECSSLLSDFFRS